MSTTKNIIENLKNHWGITSTFQVIIVLIVFACTGFTVLYVEDQILLLFNTPEERNWWLASLIFVFLTMPLYNLILLVYGFVFGQFKFFWNFEKKFFGGILRIFKKRG